MALDMSTSLEERPKIDLVRALPSSLEIREAPGGAPQMFGHFAVFNRWTEIDSFYEGRFLERIAQGAFKKTFRENGDSIKVLAEHGFDPMIGKRALGTPKVLREEEEGAYYEVDLVDAQDVRELILPRLRAGLYGASFRFSVVREETVEEPDPSDENPLALAERTIKECRLFEFGPVTFPAYADATANARSRAHAMRSMTDEYNAQAFVKSVARMNADPRLKRAMEAAASGPVEVPAATPDPVEEPAAEAVPEVEGAPTVDRADSKTVGIVGQMLTLGAEFLEIEDQPDDAADRAAMEAVLTQLSGILSAEVDEPEDDAGRAAGDEGETATTPPPSTDDERPSLPRADEPLYGTEQNPPWLL
jgi:HK97 family phage prohead protease